MDVAGCANLCGVAYATLRKFCKNDARNTKGARRSKRTPSESMRPEDGRWGSRFPRFEVKDPTMS